MGPLLSVSLRQRGWPQKAAGRLQICGTVRATFPPRAIPVRHGDEQVQIDHTVVDLMIVDEHDREPIGRPYLTMAIDVFSRRVLGFVVTLEPQSAVSVGLCLGRVNCDKKGWLEALGLAGQVQRPMAGKPRRHYSTTPPSSKVRRCVGLRATRHRTRISRPRPNERRLEVHIYAKLLGAQIGRTIRGVRGRLCREGAAEHR